MNQKKKIKILFLHANNKDIGGADYCLFKLVNQLDKRRFTSVVCLSMRTEILKLYDKAGIKTYLIDMERIKKSKNPFYLSKILLKIVLTVIKVRKLIKKKNIDIVHGNDFLDIYGSIAGRLANVVTLQHCRMIIVNPILLRIALSNFVYAINNRVIAISNSVAEEMFSKKKGHVKPKIVVSYDWFDFETIGHETKNRNIRGELKIHDKTHFIGVIGRLDYWKGQNLFIKAACIVLKSFPSAKFLIVGGSVSGRGREFYRDELIKLACDLGIKNKIIFTGHREDIYDIISSLDILVLSSSSPEPLGQVVMEANACSKPVVASNAGGPPEIIENGKTGLLYPIGNYKKMAEAIIYLLEHPDLATKMGRAGKERVEKVFNKNNICAKMESLYEELVCQ